MTQDQQTFTGRVRRRKTGLRVKIADVVSRITITTAGIGTIVAVSTVCVFLAWVVVPLFAGGKAAPLNRLPSLALFGAHSPAHIAVDEYEVIGFSYTDDGLIHAFRLDTGEQLWTRTLFETPPVSHTFALRGGDVIFGFADGTVRLGNIHYETSFIPLSQVLPEERNVDVGAPIRHGQGIMQLTPTGQFRLQEVDVRLDPPVTLAAGTPVRLVDVSMLMTGPVFASLTEDGRFHVNSVRRVQNIMTGQETLRLSGGSVMIDDIATRGLPNHLFLEGRADTAILAWNDGFAVRLDTRDRSAPVIAERIDLIEDPNARITAATMMIGKMTLVVGDSRGRIYTWFRVKPDYAPDETPPTSDASLLVRVQELPGSADAAITSLAASTRKRTLLAGDAGGRVRLLHITSSQLLEDMSVFDSGAPVIALAMSPKDNGFLAASRDGFARWSVYHPHPETTLRSIFTRVWYEGFSRPEHVWQSSSGTDEFEPKYGLIPLIFGTLKATVYTMLFAVPIALLAAVYTSEFLHPRTKAKIKPTVEIMASLPSVVLGFLAALVIAPFIENVVPMVLAAFVTLPLAWMTGAFLWQLLPRHLAMRFERLRLVAMVAAIPVGLVMAWAASPVVESALFAGDLKGWLAWSGDAELRDRFADATGGWMFVMLPLCGLLSVLGLSLGVNPALRDRMIGYARLPAAVAHFVKFIIAVIAAISMALALSKALSLLGLDPRGLFLGTYIQRNSLIVGFIMGFAVIPIIYTISEDALSAVPEHLRAGSLGAGATPWQTAFRIVIPTAMSGLFSAVMIGLGRAVGETMIVLMATGNTPVMDWNIFNGFRTLSANIAVELPEAVQNGTNYRMLFLAALTLFIMTFILNTIAESVRMRFRKRAYQL